MIKSFLSLLMLILGINFICCLMLEYFVTKTNLYK